MPSASPRKKFSFHNFKLRLRSSSSSDIPPLPTGDVSPDPLPVKRMATEPLPRSLTSSTASRSASIDKNLPPLPVAQDSLIQAHESPPLAMPTPYTDNSEMHDMPQADRTSSDGPQLPDLHMPEPELAITMPTPATPTAPNGTSEALVSSGPVLFPQIQLLAAPHALPPVIQPTAEPDTGDDIIAGLADVAEKVHDSKAKPTTSNRAVAADKMLGSVEGKINAVSDMVTKAQSVVQPVVTALAPSEPVQALERGIKSLMEGIPYLMKSLDEVSKIHPFISVAVLAFKAAYTMEMTRRNNDKRITTLYVSIKDMIAVLVQLRTVKDPRDVGPDGRTIEARLESLAKQTATDIKECANACDTYQKKHILVKVLKGPGWETRLVGWIETFTKRKGDFEFALAQHTARVVDAVNSTLGAVDDKINAMQDALKTLLRSLTPSTERELAVKVREKGGAQVVQENDTVLRELLKFETNAIEGRGDHKGNATKDMTEHGLKYFAGKPQQTTDRRAVSRYTLQDLKDELHEDWADAIHSNMEAFEGKFMLHQRQLQEELSKFIQEENNRLLDEVNKGPHDLIKDSELKILWKEMNWRRNVKARLFVMTLRDNYSEITTTTPTNQGAEAAPEGSDDAERNDDWAFQFINVSNLQSIMEAFDDDGSGYVTVAEVNRFIDLLPPDIKWSLPRWIAYWAIGWRQAAAGYTRKILDTLNYMHSVRRSVLPENRFWVDYYLGKVWQRAAQLCHSLALLGELPPWLEDKFKAYVDCEEKRIKDNLSSVRYDIDALDTVYIVAGPGRIEKHVYTLLYLLLQRDVEIFEKAKTDILHKDELWDSADSILWVYDAVDARYNDLKALFVQQKLDVDQHFKRVAGEMFDYWHDLKPLFGMKTMATREWSMTWAELPVGKWDDSKDKLLNYTIDEQYPYKCEAYETTCEQPTEIDTHWQASMPVQAILGQWNGFVYDEECYPALGMTSFYAHASSEDGVDFTANGLDFDRLDRDCNMSLKGTCDHDCDGVVSVNFALEMSDESSTSYFSGHLLPDGSLVGTQGWESNASEHSNRFILKRIPAEIMCHRPSPHELKETKTRVKALWRFATQAVRAQVLRERWSWTYFAERRDRRKNLLKYNLRQFHYGPPLTESELQSRHEARRLMTAQDLDFQQSIMKYQLRIVPSHLEFSCDACHEELGGERVICLDCQPANNAYYSTVDFCGNLRCWAKTTVDQKQREDLESPHIPEHDFLKIRTVMQYMDQPELDRRAKVALEACRKVLSLDVTRAVNEKEKVANKEGAEHFDTENSGDPVSKVSGAGIQNEPFEPRTGVVAEVSTESSITSVPQGQKDDVKSVSSTATHKQNRTCSVCRGPLTAACWYCVDCNDRGVELFICDTCEAKTLLRCHNECDRLFEQPTWYYGNRSNDSFMCNRCQVKGVQAPEVDRDTEHTYQHALVRCKQRHTLSFPEPKHDNKNKEDTKSITVEDRMTELEKIVRDQNIKLAGLEDSLKRVQEALSLLLTKIS